MADTSTAMNGAASGAAAGSTAGPYGALVGGAVGLGGALLAKKKKPPTIDTGPMIQALQNGAQSQRNIVGNLKTQLEPLAGQYSSGVGSAETEAADARRSAASDFLDKTGKAQDLQGKELSDVLKQKVLGALPEESNALRENLAANGGLQRGGANVAFEDQATQAQRELNEGNQQIALQTGQQTQAALDKINTMDNQYILDKLGIDKDTLAGIYQSGRQDLIDEANQLLGIETNLQSNITGVQQFGANQQLASGVAGQKNQQDFINALINAGSTALGSYAARK